MAFTYLSTIIKPYFSGLYTGSRKTVLLNQGPEVLVMLWNYRLHNLTLLQAFLSALVTHSKKKN